MSEASVRTPRCPRLSVNVEDRHITTAIPENSGHCMIADAVADEFNKRFKRKATAIHVDIQTIRLTDPKRRVRFVYLTPAAAQRAIIRFDHGLKPEAFKMRLGGGQAIQIKRPPQKKGHPNQVQAGRKMGLKHRARLKRMHSRGAEISGGAEPPPSIGLRRAFGLMEMYRGSDGDSNPLPTREELDASAKP